MKLVMGIIQAVIGIIWIGIVALLTTIGIVHITTKSIVSNVKNKIKGDKNEQ